MIASANVTRGLHYRFSFSALALVFVLSGCTPEPSGGAANGIDLAAEKVAVLARDQEWHAAVAAKKDAAHIASFFTEDGIMIGSGQATSVGRPALIQAVRALLSGPDFNDDWTWDRVELSADGKLAYLVGTTRITVNDPSGKPVTTQARLINVWRKDPDGVWRCAVDVWVHEPAAGPAPAG